MRLLGGMMLAMLVMILAITIFWPIPHTDGPNWNTISVQTNKFDSAKVMFKTYLHQHVDTIGNSYSVSIAYRPLYATNEFPNGTNDAIWIGGDRYSIFLPSLHHEDGTEVTMTNSGKTFRERFNSVWRHGFLQRTKLDYPMGLGTLSLGQLWKVKRGKTYYLNLMVVCRFNGEDSRPVAFVLDPVKVSYE